MAKSSRTYYLDALRIIAICAIVLLHVAGSYWYLLDVSSFDWAVINAYDCITRWGVPVFVMISGALFLDPERPQPLRKLWTKNIPRLAALVVFWGLLYALVYDWPHTWSAESASAFLHDLLFGTPHLWFLFMLIGLYVIIPLLRCITANEQATRYFLVLGLIVNVIIPPLNSTGCFGIGQEIYTALLLEFPLGYSFFFVLGYYLSSHDLSRIWRFIIYAIGVAGLIAATLATAWLSNSSDEANKLVIQNTYPFAFAAAGVFIAAKRFFQKHTLSEACLGTVYTFSSCTLGVYVVHIFVLRALMRFGISALDPNPLLGSLCLAAIAIVLSFAIAYMLKKIPFFGNYLV